MMSCDAAIILLHVLSIAIVLVCFADVHGHNCNASSSAGEGVLRAMTLQTLEQSPALT